MKYFSQFNNKTTCITRVKFGKDSYLTWWNKKNNIINKKKVEESSSMLFGQ